MSIYQGILFHQYLISQWHLVCTCFNTGFLTFLHHFIGFKGTHTGWDNNWHLVVPIVAVSSFPSGQIFIPVTPLAFHQMWNYQVDYAAIPQDLQPFLTSIPKPPTGGAKVAKFVFRSIHYALTLDFKASPAVERLKAKHICCSWALLHFLIVSSLHVQCLGAVAHKLTVVGSLWTSCQLSTY